MCTAGCLLSLCTGMPSMASASVVQLSDEERADFDGRTGDDIQHADVKRLQKAHQQHYQNEGFQETAAAISARLSELGSYHKTYAAAEASAYGCTGIADTAEARSSILSFQEELKQRHKRGQQAASYSNGVEGMQPPVRSSKESGTGAGSAAAGVEVIPKGPPAATAPRRSADLLTPDDRQLGRDPVILQRSGTAPKLPPAAAAAAGVAGLGLGSPGAVGLSSMHQQQQEGKAGKGHVMIQEVEARGSRRTQMLLEQNLLLSEVERHVAAETARCRGNDLFRCGSCAEAVEEYSLAIGLHSEQVAAYTNRSAAYVKLKQWEFAVVDATSALDISMAQGIAPDSDLVAKAFLHRADAYMGLGKHQEASKDYDQVLSIMPDEVRAQQGALKARAALRDKHHQQQQHVGSASNLRTGMRRVAIQECDSSDDEQQQQQAQRHEQQGDPVDCNGSTFGDMLSSPTPAAAAVDDELAPAAAAAAAAAAAGEDQPLARGAPAGGSDASAAASRSSGGGSTETQQLGQDNYDSAVSAAAPSSAAAADGGGRDDASADTGPAAIADADPDTAAARAAGSAVIAAADPGRTPTTVGGADSAAPNLDTAAAVADFTTLAPSSETQYLHNGTWGSSSDSGSESASESNQEDQAAAAAAAAAAASTPTFDKQLDQLRLAGNEAYKAGACRDALLLYSRGLAHCPDAVALYINRSMTQIKRQQLRAAHDDAATAVALEPSSHKAYHKRHQAKQGLGDFQGAIQDLQQCITLAPVAQKYGLRQELQALHTAAADAADLAAVAASAATAAGYTDHGVVQIQEEVDDPAELQQRLHAELTAHEVIIAKRAAKIRQLAQRQRAAWQQQLDHEMQQQQQLAAAAAAARRAERAVERCARKEARTADKQQRRQARKQAAAAAAAEAVPASSVVEDQAAAATAVTAAFSPVRLDTSSNTPAEPEPISYQLQQHTPPTVAAVSHNIAAAVEQLKAQGNAALAAGHYDAAEAAYVEALQLDGDNVKVLLNLAALRLKQGNGSGALRCCDEVLAQQQQLGPDQIMKAHLRRGLALEQLGDPTAALTELLSVFNQGQEVGLTIDTQLAADMNRISDKIQQHKQEAAAAATTMAEQHQQLRRGGFTGMRASIPVVVDSESESLDTEEDLDQQRQDEILKQQQDEQQQQEEVLKQQQGGSKIILALPHSPRESLQQQQEEEEEEEEEEQQQQEVVEDPAAGTAIWLEPLTPVTAEPAAATAAVAMDVPAEPPSSPSSAVNRQPIVVVLEDCSSDTEQDSEKEANDTDADTRIAADSNSSTDVSSKVLEQVVQSAVDQPQQQQQQQQLVRAREDGDTLDKQAVQDKSTVGTALPDVQTLPAAVVHGGHADRTDTRGWLMRAQQQQPGGVVSELRRSHSSGAVDSCQPAEVAAAHVTLQHIDSLMFTTSTTANHSSNTSSSSNKPDQGQLDQTVGKAGSNPAQQQQTAAVAPFSSSSYPQQQKADTDQQQQWEQQRYNELQKLDAEVKAAALTSTLNKGLEAIQSALNQLQTTAEQERERGNAAVAKAQLHQALKHYNTAAASAPLDARSYANRAQVYLKLKRWQLCEVDCSTVLLLLRRAAAAGEGRAGDEQLRQKCRYRRALVWKELGRIRDAIGDVKHLLVEAPKDSSVQRLMNNLKQAFAKHLQQIVAQQQQQEGQEEKQQQKHQEEMQQQQQKLKGQVRAAAAAAAAGPVSQVYRHRIVIEETDGSETEDEHQQQQQQQPEQDLLVAAAAGPDAAHVQQQQSIPAAVTSNGSPAALPPAPTSAEVHTPAAAEVQNAIQYLAKHHQQLTPPKTALEFTRTAKMLLSLSPPSATDQQQQHLGPYVLLLEPIKYRSVIKRDLSDSLLELLLAGLAAVVHQEPQFVAQALHQLSQVERFGIVRSMVGRRKGVVDSLHILMDVLAAAGMPVVVLQKLYQI